MGLDQEHFRDRRRGDPRKEGRKAPSLIEFWNGLGVRDKSGRSGTVVEVSYLSVRVYFPGQGAVDFIRPRENSLAPAGAATVADLTPRDSTSAISKMISQILLSSEGFAIDGHHVVVVKNGGHKKYPLDRDATRLEAVLGALKLAVSDL